MKRFALPLLVTVLLGAFAFWWYSPVQVLKRRTHALLDTLTLESGSSKGGRQLAGYSFNALLASEVVLEAPSISEANGTFTRSEMESAFSWLCQQAKQTRFDLGKFHSVQVAGDHADVRFSLEALVELSRYRPADGRYDVTFQWQREKDGWRLTSATWAESGD
jgi:hypothetical protein